MAVCGPPEAGKRRWNQGLVPVLRTDVRRAIITVIAQLLPAEIPPTGDPPVTTAADQQIVPRQPEYLPALRAADQGVADALESVLSDNTQPRLRRPSGSIFDKWCGEIGLTYPLPADPLTVARYLAARAGDGASNCHACVSPPPP